MKNTLLVNLYAGPGAGKSTGAAYIFAKLKMAGIDCEYVSEYAKATKSEEALDAEYGLFGWIGDVSVKYPVSPKEP